MSCKWLHVASQFVAILSSSDARAQGHGMGIFAPASQHAASVTASRSEPYIWPNSNRSTQPQDHHSEEDYLRDLDAQPLVGCLASPGRIYEESDVGVGEIENRV